MSVGGVTVLDYKAGDVTLVRGEATRGRCGGAEERRTGHDDDMRPHLPSLHLQITPSIQFGMMVKKETDPTIIHRRHFLF